MCDKLNHSHGPIETWVTPRESARLRSKLIQLAPGQEMPAHTTGPGREEVITCIFGTVRVRKGNEVHTVTAGEAIFIPENTLHAVYNREEDHALYCYVVSVPPKVICCKAEPLTPLELQNSYNTGQIRN